MTKKKLIEQFERELHDYVLSFIEDREENYEDYSDELSQAFSEAIRWGIEGQSIERLRSYFCDPIYLFNIDIGGYSFAIGYNLTQLSQFSSIYIDSVEFESISKNLPSFDYSIEFLYCPTEYLEEERFVPFDNPYIPVIDKNFYCFLAEQKESDIKKLSFYIEREKFKNF